MNEQIKGRCTFCGSVILYTGMESLIKCGACGNIIVVAELENELARRDQALKEGEQAKEKLAEAETARLEAEARLKSTVDTLGGIKDGQDMLSRLMQLAIAGQKSSEDKLATMQDISARILKGQGDIFEGMSILGDLKNRLEMLGLDAQAQQDYAKSFMTWFQNIRGEDVERLQTLDKRSSELLASQKELNDTVFRLRQASSETQKALDEFHTQWKASRLEELHQLYHQAENYQQDRLFDKAYDKYEQVVTMGGGDAEVAWRMLLCHYGVYYQKNDKGEMIPIILNPDLTPPDEMSLRKDLLTQLGRVSEEARTVYMSRVAQIDRILDKYRHVRTETDYDVFISVRQQKDGHPTSDSFTAATLFHTLEKKNLRVFNSRLTPPPAGQEYEPYIIAALMSAKVMIVVGTCTENMQSDWVRNEWSRFQWLMKSEIRTSGKTDRRLICYLTEGMAPEEIPRGLNPSIQAIRDGLTAEKQLEAALAHLLSGRKDNSPKDERQGATSDQASLQDVLAQLKAVITSEKGTGWNGPVIDWRDPKLEEKMREITGITDRKITCGDVENIAKLDLSSCGITDITALKNLQNLKFLNLSGNPIEEVSALSGLTNLTELLLINDQIEDISPLQGLVNLESLWLQLNKIKDVSCLAKLRKLKSLHLKFNPIDDYAPLAGMDLKSLDFEEELDRLVYDVELKDAGDQKFHLIPIVRKILDSSLTEAKKVVYDAPVILKKGISRKEAKEIRTALEAEGAKAVLHAVRPEETDSSPSEPVDPEQAAAGYYLAGNEDNNKGNMERAAFFYQRAAELGHADAQNMIGAYYYNGTGVEKNLDQAFFWFQKAAEQGQLSALYNVAICYQYGCGTEKDMKQAAIWYQKAAEQGHMEAQNILGACYYNGDGVEEDLNQAFFWFQKAAEQGHVSAQYNMGICYEYGSGVQKDLQQALFWYRKAAEQGHENAKKALERLNA